MCVCEKGNYTLVCECLCIKKSEGICVCRCVDKKFVFLFV
jgi:hypothetical protein